MKETYRCEWVKCGKARCKSCPHGPYWYAYHRDGKKTKKRYVGKERDDLRPAGEPERAPDPWDAILNGATATAALAWQILDMEPTGSRESLTRQYRRLILLRHPDRGGSDRVAAQTQAAYRCLLRLL